jgi:hypothetical protein
VAISWKQPGVMSEFMHRVSTMASTPSFVPFFFSPSRFILFFYIFLISLYSLLVWLLLYRFIFFSFCLVCSSRFVHVHRKKTKENIQNQTNKKFTSEKEKDENLTERYEAICRHSNGKKWR